MLAVSLEHPVIAGLNWILLNRKDSTGKRFNPTSLSRAAGLARSHVGGILDENQTPNIERETAVKIARAANVRTEWLLTGHGPKEPFEGDVEEARPQTHLRLVEPEDQFPSRAQFIELARSEGGDEGIIKALRLVRLDTGADPGIEFWRKEYLRLARERRAFRADLRAVQDDDD